MNIVIVIPTYNEVDNIHRLLGEIGELSIKDHELSVLVVDDSSPDGTAKAVRAYVCDNDNVYLHTRPSKQGIGAAYIAGFDYALNTLDADYVMQMDADFSHSPSHIPPLIAQLDNGYSVVIGSRYTRGGAIHKDWPKLRYVNSRVCNNWTRWILGIRDVHDCTAGFKIIDATLLKKIKFEAFFAQSYSFQVALLHALLLQKASITEIPITFATRSAGRSKMVPKDLAQLLWHVIRLRASNPDRFVHSLSSSRG